MFAGLYRNARLPIAALVLAGAGLFYTPALAGSSGPRACAPYADRFDVPGLWLGHFTGGRRAYHANGDMRVDWHAEYRCFFSARACQSWRAGLRRVYARYEGHGTCLALRGGGRPYHRTRGAIVARF